MRMRWACVCGRVRDRNNHQVPRVPPCCRRHNADERHASAARTRGHRERAHPPSTRGRSPARCRTNETPSSRRRMSAAKEQQPSLGGCHSSTRRRRPCAGREIFRLVAGGGCRRSPMKPIGDDALGPHDRGRGQVGAARRRGRVAMARLAHTRSCHGISRARNRLGGVFEDAFAGGNEPALLQAGESGPRPAGSSARSRPIAWCRSASDGEPDRWSGHRGAQTRRVFHDDDERSHHDGRDEEDDG